MYMCPRCGGKVSHYVLFIWCPGCGYWATTEEYSKTLGKAKSRGKHREKSKKKKRAIASR